MRKGECGAVKWLGPAQQQSSGACKNKTDCWSVPQQLCAGPLCICDDVQSHWGPGLSPLWTFSAPISPSSGRAGWGQGDTWPSGLLQESVRGPSPRGEVRKPAWSFRLDQAAHCYFPHSSRLTELWWQSHCQESWPHKGLIRRFCYNKKLLHRMESSEWWSSHPQQERQQWGSSMQGLAFSCAWFRNFTAISTMKMD